MKINHLLLFSMAFLLFACGNTKMAEEITGTYYGILPCADCPGIYYELKLNENFTYSEKRFYLESEADTFLVRGSFHIETDSTILLTENDGTLDQLKFSNGELKVLDRKGNEITSKLSEMYVLTTKPVSYPFREIPTDDKKSNFKATGTEPFWALELDEENDRMRFDPMEGKTIITKLPEAKQIKDRMVYEANSETGTLNVSLLNQTCQNDMSGELFSHRVSVSFKYPEMKEATTYTGCGEYLGANLPLEIKGKWILVKINEKNIEKEPNFTIPTLTIKPSKGKVMGNAGCNQYSGSIKSVEKNIIGISRVVSTKMACSGSDLERTYLKGLTEKPLMYEINAAELVLRNNATSLVFEKMD